MLVSGDAIYVLYSMRHKKSNTTVAGCARICAEHLEQIFIARIYAVRSTGHVHWNTDPRTLRYMYMYMYIHVLALALARAMYTSASVHQPLIRESFGKRPQAKSTIKVHV